MGLKSAISNLKYDTRMQTINLKRGLLSKDELSSHVSSLEDVAEFAQAVTLEAEVDTGGDVVAEEATIEMAGAEVETSSAFETPTVNESFSSESLNGSSSDESSSDSSSSDGSSPDASSSGDNSGGGFTSGF